jgi:hypothetical protein
MVERQEPHIFMALNLGIDHVVPHFWGLEIALRSTLIQRSSAERSHVDDRLTHPRLSSDRLVMGDY